MKLVIVESGAKSKTIERFLGPGHKVAASNGHIRDLPPKKSAIPKRLRDKSWAELGVDTEGDFKPIYIVPQKSKKQVRELKKLVSGAKEVLLATDVDREGEAISWHLVEVLNLGNGRRPGVKRIVFQEITRGAIEEALANPREVNLRLVYAQEARRVLDRLYGYSLSPVLWRKVHPRLSAGRVQSVALRLVVDREEERRAFTASQYWGVNAQLASDELDFSAALVRIGGKPLVTGKDFDPVTGNRRSSSRAVLLDEGGAGRISKEALASLPWRVASVEPKAARRRPPPPFTTSTLQQAASSRLRMSPKRTMYLAQGLYEGVSFGKGEREGLITYMRTDSVTLSRKALGDAGRYIRGEFGDDYYNGPRFYKTKSKAAQEAHEAIRPTVISRTPEKVAPFLEKDQLKLYRLIWSRTVASQMTDARFDKTTVNLEVRIGVTDHTFRATGSVLRFPGFQKVYGSGNGDRLLPALAVGDRIFTEEALRLKSKALLAEPPTFLRSVEPEVRQTKPRPRYTEASLVKKMEEVGIGRPSTYTPTLSKIQERDYVRKKRGGLIPTFLGIAVNQLLVEHFSRYVDLDFTAQMENVLDKIAALGDDTAADDRRLDFLEGFYEGLTKQIEEALPEYPKIPFGTCPDTGKLMCIKIGRWGPYAERGEDGEVERVTLPRDRLIDELTVPRLAKLFTLPRTLGTDPKGGEDVIAGVNKYGPHVRRGKEYGSLESLDHLFTVTLEEALEILERKKNGKGGKKVLKVLGPHPESGAEIQVVDGRYGPYVTDGTTNATIPRGQDPQEKSLEEAVRLLAAKRGSAKRGSRRSPRK